MKFQKTVLSNGLRVVTEKLPSNHAVSMGIWVDRGSRDESPSEMGMSHLLEHLVFKGTKNRSAFDIAASLEALGGDLNAFTSKENTCFHALVLKKHWRIALDVLSDLVCNMDLKPQDFLLEKAVIEQEIASADEAIEDYVFEEYLKEILASNSLGLPILGTKQSLKKVTQDKIEKYYSDHYSPDQMVVAAAGGIDHEQFVSEVERKLSHLKPKGKSLKRKKPKAKVVTKALIKESEQIHLVAGFPVPSFKDDFRFEAFILNNLLGGGMTSRLYQKIREEKGLAYSVHSQLSTFTDFGMIQVYLATDPSKVRESLQLLRSQVHQLRKEKLKKSELQLYKQQIQGALWLGSDDVENRMNSIAINEMVFQEYKPVQKIVSEIQKVSLDSLNEMIDQYLQPNRISLVAAGMMKSSESKWIREFDFTERGKS